MALYVESRMRNNYTGQIYSKIFESYFEILQKHFTDASYVLWQFIKNSSK